MQPVIGVQWRSALGVRASGLIGLEKPPRQVVVNTRKDPPRLGCSQARLGMM